MRIVLPLYDDTGSDWVLENIVRDCEKRVAVTFMRAKDVFKRLMLPVGGCQVGAQLLAQEFDRDSLVGAGLLEAEPQQVHVVGHEHVGGTGQGIAMTGVQEDQLPALMEGRREPAS